MKVRVESESTPIRHLSVQCPKCEKWFYGRSIADRCIIDETDCYFAEFACPLCCTEFNANNSKPEIKEVSYPEVYKDCLEKKEVWEQK